MVEPEFDFGDMGLDVIVSAMALHHVKEPSKQLCLFAKALKKGGTIAIADLAKEDGSFHSDNNGVYHLGFRLRRRWHLCLRRQDLRILA